MSNAPTPGRRSVADLFRRVFDLEGRAGVPTGEFGQRPVVRLCNLILVEAFMNQAKEVKLSECDPTAGSVEYLIGEEWRPVMRIPIQAHRLIINRLKVMAGLDIAKVPDQEGELHVRFQGVTRILAIRIQAVPTGGDIATLRIDAAAPCGRNHR